MNILKVLTKNRIKGNIGEQYAAKYLRKKGYRIVKRNYVSGDNEIDIIAESKSTLAFVEVKARTVKPGNSSQLFDRPAFAVTPQKQKRIISAARIYLSGVKNDKRISLDVIEVYLTEDGKPIKDKINHIENAFNLNTASK